jgi:hypothetical protein
MANTGFSLTDRFARDGGAQIPGTTQHGMLRRGNTTTSDGINFG